MCRGACRWVIQTPQGKYAYHLGEGGEHHTPNPPHITHQTHPTSPTTETPPGGAPTHTGGDTHVPLLPTYSPGASRQPPCHRLRLLALRTARLPPRGVLVLLVSSSPPAGPPPAPSLAGAAPPLVGGAPRPTGLPARQPAAPGPAWWCPPVVGARRRAGGAGGAC